MAKKHSGRIEGGFVALPWTVLDSPAWVGLSYPARCLLLELARQYNGHNNGSLLASSAYLIKRGWSSNAVITRAKRDLIKSEFIHETVMGNRPNRASWYALTWQAIDRLPGYDAGALESFRRGAFRPAPLLALVPKAPSREDLYERHRCTPTIVRSLNRMAVQG